MSYALITGASKGIGKAIAYNLASKKIDLILVARSKDLLKGMASDLSAEYGIKVNYFCIDLTFQDAADKVLQWTEENNLQINILVNNAGYGLGGKFERYSAQMHAEMLNVNIISLVKLTSLFLPMLERQSQSYIVNIASTAAYQAIPHLSSYAASKSFVVSFSRALQRELIDTKVSVTCVSPGGTQTDFATRANVGRKAIKAGEKLSMDPSDVAEVIVNSMFKKKKEVIPGFINRVGAFLVWLAPKGLSERVAGKLYQ